LAFSVCQLDGSTEQCKQVVRLCTQEYALRDKSNPERFKREQSMMNLSWALALADDPGPPEFRAMVLKGLQQDLHMQRWPGRSEDLGGDIQAQMIVHQMYSYLLVLQELEWEQAMRQQLQQKRQVGGAGAQVSAPPFEALYLPRAPFHPPFGQAQAAGNHGGSADRATGLRHQSAPASRFSGSNLSGRRSSRSGGGEKYLPWDEPWLQQLMQKLASITDQHYTRGSGFERAVRSALVMMC
ncbi:hypothetical protein DUNSADRAFT_14178, partial [Dunaliella salina]